MGLLARQFDGLFGEHINLPSVHEARWLTEQSRFTPDAGWLEAQEFQLLFCVDDTKKGHSHHTLISDHTYYGSAYTAKKYQFWEQHAGNDRIPIPMEVDQNALVIKRFPPPLKIKGELYLVRTNQFFGLDTYKRNTVQFRRKRVNVFLPYRHIKKQENIVDRDDNPCLFHPRGLPRCLQGNVHTIVSSERLWMIRAWTYVGKPDYWDDVLDCGWRGFKTVYHVETDRPWLKEYYAFPKRPLIE